MYNFCKTQLAAFNALKKDQGAATAVEYGLISALLSVVIVTAMSTFGTALTGAVTKIVIAMNPT